MALALVDIAIPARIDRQGQATISLAAGKHLKIETSPGGEELLDAVVPSGKVWEADIAVYVKETNA